MRIQSALSGIDRAVEFAVIVTFAVMLLAGSLQIVNRFVLNASMSWTEELQKYLHIWMIYLAIPIAYNRSAHIGVDLFREMLPAPLRQAVVWITDLCWILLAVAIVGYTIKVMGVAQAQTSPGLGIRFDLIYLGQALGGGYLLLCVLRRLLLGATAGQGAS